MKKIAKIKWYIKTRRFYLTGDMTNLYPFIQCSLEWLFGELFSSNVSLWIQYICIAFTIFSYRILIISYKILIITDEIHVSNEKTSELTIRGILCRSVTMFTEKSCNYFHYILRLFGVITNFPLPTSETMHDYYL